MSNARFSDLDMARFLTRRLRGQEGREPRGEGEYARFDGTEYLRTLASQRSKGRAYGAHAWNELLDALRNATGASAAFLIDAEGLAVAVRGDVGGGELEELGARLLVALDQVARLSAKRGAGEQALISMALERQWLTGIRRRLASPERVLVAGLLSAEPMSAEQLDSVQSLLELFDRQ